MATKLEEDVETTADEKGFWSDSSSNSDVELNYDRKRGVLKARLDDKVFDVKFTKKYETKEELFKDMLKTYLTQVESHRRHSTEYLSKLNQNEEWKTKLKASKSAWYQDNKERLRKQQLDRYTTDEAYRARVIEKNHRAYVKRTEGVEKQKRGRKPKPKQEGEPIETKPRGRPKLAPSI